MAVRTVRNFTADFSKRAGFYRNFRRGRPKVFSAKGEVRSAKQTPNRRGRRGRRGWQPGNKTAELRRPATCQVRPAMCDVPSAKCEAILRRLAEIQGKEAGARWLARARMRVGSWERNSVRGGGGTGRQRSAGRRRAEAWRRVRESCESECSRQCSRRCRSRRWC